MSAAARFRYTLVAGSTAVVIGSGFTVAGLRGQAADDTTVSPRAAAAPAPAAAPGSAGEDLGLGVLPSDDPSTPAATTPAAPPSSATPKPRITTKAAKPKATTKPTRKPTKKAVTAPATSGSITDQVLAHINAARAEEGRSALKLDADLSEAAALHNQEMIDGCDLKHQCPGEKGLERFADQGVSFRTAGENIGFSSAGSSTGAQVRAANGLTDGMLAEKAPNDGHRQNLLNDDFTKIGLSVVRDSEGIIWFTQDFVG